MERSASLWRCMLGGGELEVDTPVGSDDTAEFCADFVVHYL